MQTQKLCLKWNNHTTNFLSVLESFQKKGILVDVTISCEGQIIKAHKMVLSACSPYFQNIFLDNPCKHPVVIINGIKYDDITAILNFMYKGEVNVSQDGLSSFLQAAEALKVKGLAEVCGEKKSSTNSINQEVQQNEQNRPQRTDTPPRKRHRNRKRSASDSNRSDDEGTSRKNREPSSPEIHELSGDESFTGDNTSNGPPFNSVPRVPQNLYSRSHQSSSNLVGEEDDDFEVEPSKLLEQTLTTESVSMNNSNSDNNLRIERIIGNATEIESSSMQEPESPPDIKPIIDYGESSAGPSDGNLMLYSEQSQPGPSNMQDGSLLHDNSHAQGCIVGSKFEVATKQKLFKNRLKQLSKVKEKKYKCTFCFYSSDNRCIVQQHLVTHYIKPEVCPYCQKAPTVRPNRRALFVQDKSRFIVKQCDVVFHIKDHNYDITICANYVCSLCHNKFRCILQCKNRRRERQVLLLGKSEAYEVFNMHCSSRNRIRQYKDTFLGSTKNKYVCSFCPYSSNQSGNLRTHLASHSGKKPYTCSECQKSFTLKHHLRDHMIVHTGEKPYTCEKCGLAFGRKPHLRRHELIHLRKRHYCVVCGAGFEDSISLDEHVRTHINTSTTRVKYEPPRKY